MWLKQSLIIMTTLAMVACQTVTTQQGSNDAPKKPDTPKTVTTPDGVKIIPYDRPDIKRQSVDVIIPQQQKSAQRLKANTPLPAYKSLIQKAHSAFQAGQWDTVEQNALQAQRISPQAAEAYIYLAMVSNHKNQPKNAESLARRGLGFAQTDSAKRQLWQTILKSGQLQKKNDVIQEAQARLKSL